MDLAQLATPYQSMAVDRQGEDRAYEWLRDVFAIDVEEDAGIVMGPRPPQFHVSELFRSGARSDVHVTDMATGKKLVVELKSQQDVGT